VCVCVYVCMCVECALWHWPELITHDHLWVHKLIRTHETVCFCKTDWWGISKAIMILRSELTCMLYRRDQTATCVFIVFCLLSECPLSYKFTSS